MVWCGCLAVGDSSHQYSQTIASFPHFLLSLGGEFGGVGDGLVLLRCVAVYISGYFLSFFF